MTAPLSFTLLGYPLRLADPAALRLVLVAAAIGLAGALSLLRRRAALARAAGALAPRVAPGAGGARPALRLALSTAGLALLGLALARPQAGLHAEVEARAGVDLALVVDASRSMLAQDVRPGRLRRAKLELAALLDRLAGDRVAIVAFAGDAFVQCPLTSDLAAARLFLRAVEPGAMPRQGTALAPALDAAREALGPPGGRARVVLVVSDGEDQEEGVASAARALADAGVRISALAVGTADGGTIPEPPEGSGRVHRDARGAAVTTRLDATALRLLADVGRGAVYALDAPGRDLEAFRASLEQLARPELEQRVLVAWEERYAAAAFPGFLLLLAALLLRDGRRGAAEAP